MANDYNALIYIHTRNPSSFESYKHLKLADQEYLVLYQDNTWPAQDPVQRFNKRELVDNQFTNWRQYCLLYEAQDVNGLLTAVDTYGSSWFKHSKGKVLNFLNGVNENE